MDSSPDEKVVREQYDLHKAIFNNDLKKVIQILKQGKDLIDKKVLERERSCLCWSKKSSNLIIVWLELKASRELNYFYFR